MLVAARSRVNGDGARGARLQQDRHARHTRPTRVAGVSPGGRRHGPICDDMVAHMKTTIELSDSLLEEARAVMAREGVTLRALVEEGLRRSLDDRKRRQPPFRLRDASVAGTGLRPELRDAGWERLRDLAYGEPERDDE